MLPIVNRFQSTPLHKGRLADSDQGDEWTVFQSTPLHKGRPAALFAKSSLRMFQSTPLHKGRPLSLVVCLIPAAVSIHAPA